MVKVQDIKIKETMDYSRLKPLFEENDLHYPSEDPVETSTVMCFEALNGEELAGGCIIGLREGKYILDGIATDEKYRGTGLGKILMNKVVDFLKEKAKNEIFLLAKVPSFYENYGFKEDILGEAPYFYECEDCELYGKECDPKIMKFSI